MNQPDLSAGGRTSVPIPGCEPASLLLPEPLPPEAVGRLEGGIAALLRRMRSTILDDSGDREYLSWLANIR